MPKFIRRVVVNGRNKYKIQFTSSKRWIRFFMGWWDYIGSYTDSKKAVDMMHELDDNDGKYVPIK